MRRGGAGPATRGDDRGKGGKAERRALPTQDQAEAERLRLVQRQRQLLDAARIEITDTAWPGVRIQIGQAWIQLSEPASCMRYRWDPERNAITAEPIR
jgi:hypothetical protein